MNTRTLATYFVAAALTASAAGAIAAQPFGRDSVYAAPGQATTSRATVEVTRFGRDSVYVTKDTQFAKPTGNSKMSVVAPKAGRA